MPTPKYKREFHTLTKGQKTMWVRAIKAGFEPLLTVDGSLRRTKCPKCRRNALIYTKVDLTYIVCSNAHFTPFNVL